MGGGIVETGVGVGRGGVFELKLDCKMIKYILYC